MGFFSGHYGVFLQDEWELLEKMGKSVKLAMFAPVKKVATVCLCASGHVVDALPLKNVNSKAIHKILL